MDEERCLTGRLRLAGLMAEAVEVAYDLANETPELDELAWSVLYTADLAELALEIEAKPFEDLDDQIS